MSIDRKNYRKKITDIITFFYEKESIEMKRGIGVGIFVWHRIKHNLWGGVKQPDALDNIRSGVYIRNILRISKNVRYYFINFFYQVFKIDKTRFFSKHMIYIYMYVCVCIFVFNNASTRPGWDTRLIFKRSLIRLNWEFSFFETSCLTEPEEIILPYYLIVAWRRIVEFILFPSTHWNANSLVLVLNSCRRVHFPRW